MTILVARVVMSEEKQLFMERVKETRESVQVVVVNEAETIATVPKETVEGNTI